MELFLFFLVLTIRIARGDVKMSRALSNLEFIDTVENETETPKTFSSIVNNDDILQMYLK